MDEIDRLLAPEKIADVVIGPVSLSDKQKEDIVKAFNGGEGDLKELTEAAFGPGYDGRTEQGRAVKRFLAEKGIEARSKFNYQKKTDDIILTEEHKTFIANNAHGKAFQLARELFENPKLTPLSAEARVVEKFLETLDSTVRGSNGREDLTFNPPKTQIHAIARIRRYVQNCPMNEASLTQKNKMDIQSLIGFMHNTRFLQTIRGFGTIEDRELFEDRFINYTYDKSDLLPEEVDAYINLCIDIVDFKNLVIKIDTLNGMMMDAAQNDKRLSMVLATAIKDAESERNSNLKRQEVARKTLIGSREKRLNELKSGYASLTNLVGSWREEEQRVKLIKYAMDQEKLLGEEIDKIQDFDDVIALIAGIDKREILHGKF